MCKLSFNEILYFKIKIYLFKNVNEFEFIFSLMCSGTFESISIMIDTNS